MKVLIENYGCELNRAEMNALSLSLEEINISVTEDIHTKEDIDAVVINTCSVRETAEERALGRISHWNGIAKNKPGMLIYVTGCMGERIGDALKAKFKHITAIVPNNSKPELSHMIASKSKEFTACKKYQFVPHYTKHEDFNAYIPIMNGCNNFCSYCIVPFVRGREISRDIEEILNEVRYVDATGSPVITLLGQNVNSYSFNKETFTSLVEKIDSLDLRNVKSIRFESPHPKDFNDELIYTLKNSRYFSHHFHIPVQSGSSRILELMNRRYTRLDALDLFDKIKSEIPDATFSLDLMVGFPTETKAEFNETLSFVKEVGPIDAFMYYWNKREGTKAAEMTNGTISKEQRISRLETLVAFQRANALKIKMKRLQMTRLICVTGVSKQNKDEVFGFDIHTLEGVVFEGKRLYPGDVVQVRLVGLNGNTYKGERV